MGEINTKIANEPLSIEMIGQEWQNISNGLDKLLDLEARQDHKTLADTDFGILERLIQKLESLSPRNQPMKLFVVAEHEKCGGCNWESRFLYFASHSQEEANAMYQENERGLCGECLADLFHEHGYGILPPASAFEGIK